MGRKKCSDDNGGKKKRKAVRSTIDLKKKIIAKFEAGTRVADLVKEFEMPRTTIASIIKKKDAIKSAEVAQGVTILCF
uniref:HTH psq-type domain-containing protein n=1 Tax=Arion vulgaris TaxID=1028688 RepID=A0A0B7BSD8_9EUPU